MWSWKNTMAKIKYGNQSEKILLVDLYVLLQESKLPWEATKSGNNFEIFIEGYEKDITLTGNL